MLDEQSIYDRPGHNEVAKLAQDTNRQIEAIDTPADFILEAVAGEFDHYQGAIPTSRPTLKAFVLSLIKSASAPTAVSAMLEAYVAQDESTHINDAIRRVLCIVNSQSNPALACDAIAIAMGFHISDGRSLEEIAARYGITKQALSKRAIRFCEDLGMDPSPLMRSMESRESYRLKQSQRHAAAKAVGKAEGTISHLRAKLRAAREHVTGNRLREAMPA